MTYYWASLVERGGGWWQQSTGAFRPAFSLPEYFGYISSILSQQARLQPLGQLRFILAIQISTDEAHRGPSLTLRHFDHGLNNTQADSVPGTTDHCLGQPNYDDPWPVFCPGRFV